MQLVFAGKAHPADEIGKEMISRIVHFSRDPVGPPQDCVRRGLRHLRGRRAITQGSDVWLNTPRRPMEASGTSGGESGAQRLPSTARSSTDGGTRCSTAATAGPSGLRRVVPGSGPPRTTSRPTVSSGDPRTPDRPALLRAPGRSASIATGFTGSKESPRPRSGRRCTNGKHGARHRRDHVRADRGKRRQHVGRRPQPNPGLAAHWTARP